jgi:hypothetical protein
LFNPLPVNLSAEFVDEGGDEFWMHKLVLEPVQDRRLKRVSSHC